MTIGCPPFATTASFYGWVDEIRVYANRVLTAGEVNSLALYNVAPSSVGLRAYFPFSWGNFSDRAVPANPVVTSAGGATFASNPPLCVMVNFCLSNPCINGATCQPVYAGYICQCAAGYSGVTCQTDINECASNPCRNGGTCMDGVNSFYCQCVSGYSGVLCDTDINECNSNPCQHSGTCHDFVNGFFCTCAAGYTGRFCETDINECASQPCMNGATCIDYLNSFYCNCVSG